MPHFGRNFRRSWPRSRRSSSGGNWPTIWKARQAEPFDPDAYDDDDEIELERQLDLERSAANRLLVERAKVWLLRE